VGLFYHPQAFDYR